MAGSNQFLTRPFDRTYPKTGGIKMASRKRQMIKNAKILLTAKQIEARVTKLGKQIDHDYRDKDGVVLICVLKGASVFTEDLSRQIKVVLVKKEYLRASSYGNEKKSSGEVIILDPTQSIAGEDVIVVEDIMDTGQTLIKLRAHLLAKGPRSLKICTLLDKPGNRQAPIKPDYVGFEIPDRFVFGYGLDLEGLYRNLPDIWYLK